MSLVSLLATEIKIGYFSTLVQKKKDAKVILSNFQRNSTSINLILFMSNYMKHEICD